MENSKEITQESSENSIKEKCKKSNDGYMAEGMIFGSLVGVVFGAIVGNQGLFVGVGLALGMVFGMSIKKK